MRFKSTLYNFWIKLSGPPSEFPLNARIFHSVCLISFAALTYNVPFNYFIGLPKIALISLVVLLVTASLYYTSRFRNQFSISILIANIVGLILFIINYFLNSGLRGPTDLFFLLFLLLSIGISPAKQYKIWIPVNILVVVTLNTIQYFYPETVPYTYIDRYSAFIDHTSAYVVVSILAYICTDYIRRSYESEKTSALEKSRFIAEKNQQIIKQNVELERINGEKNKLMSIVAHDVRAPLASIQNFLELLTEYDLDEAERQDIKRELLNATNDTMALLSKLLNWSKSQLNGVSAHQERLNLDELLNTTLALEKSSATRKNIKLDYDTDPAIEIFADRDMMQVVFRNLIGNAIKFTPEGGQVSIGSQLSGNECIITVRDNGIGISAERQAVIFSLNVQSTYGTKNEKGVGLGLLLTQEFVVAQDGKIWFESVPSDGTTFFIAIPRAPKSSLVGEPDQLQLGTSDKL
ncbi:HAMP domain-containing histidine kinase [Dyadobacter sp. CY107]|uniref:sensor histidine kinase n=1 Tax=Dyadobacter fanqingshengii TaxID=2906443 RepID=UPI001F187FC2|nr:HAMP domain-containing sensor histidine kinase [Dyadobacter fanqingshengii]MCF2502362.1 HAMP domain-containing histidine kinase [Dyadobacter fanqingshengii]